MHVRDVVALEVVVDVDLPVAVDVVADAAVVAVAFEVAIGAQALVDALDEGIEVGRVGFVDGGEHQALPHAHGELRQLDLADVEVRGGAHFRRRAQRAVQRVGPAVVAAAQRLRRQAVALRQRTGAMAADVVEDADLAVGAAHGDHRQAGEIADDVVAGVLQLAHVREELPAAIEDQRAVERDRRGVGVVARGNAVAWSSGWGARSGAVSVLFIQRSIALFAGRATGAGRVRPDLRWTYVTTVPADAKGRLFRASYCRAKTGSWKAPASGSLPARVAGQARPQPVHMRGEEEIG